MKAEKPRFFPFFLDSSKMNVLIVGGGRIATRRVIRLSEFDFSIQLLSPEASRKIAEMNENGELVWIRDYWQPDLDLTNFQVVIAATDQRTVNRDIVEQAKKQGVYLINQADESSRCSFYFPGIIRRNGMTVGISSDGKNYAKTKDVTKKVWALLEKD